MKKRLCILFAVVMAVTMLCGISVYAVEARYTYTYSAASDLSISGNTATCKSNARCFITVTKISYTQYLEKKNGNDWETVKDGTWSGSTTTSTLTAENSKSNLDSGTSSETIEKTSSEVTI